MGNLKSIEDTTQFVLDTNISPKVVATQGAGMAYQSVAQSMAIAVQDATDYLRNVSSITLAAIAVSTEKMVQSGNSAEGDAAEKYADIITNVQSSLNIAVDTFDKIGKTAGNVLTQFPGQGEIHAPEPDQGDNPQHS
jgi:hypothetical protein